MKTMNHSNAVDTITYTLTSYQSESRSRLYFIHAAFRDEISMICVGDDYEMATSAYRAVVNGAVTPCTLSDVLLDLCAKAEVCRTLEQSVIHFPTQEDDGDREVNVVCSVK